MPSTATTAVDATGDSGDKLIIVTTSQRTAMLQGTPVSASISLPRTCGGSVCYRF